MSLVAWLIAAILVLLPLLNGGDSNWADLLLAFAPLAMLVFNIQEKRITGKGLPRPLIWLLVLVIARLLLSFVSLLSSVSVIESLYKFFNQSSLWVFVLLSAFWLYQDLTLKRLAKIVSGVTLLLATVSLAVFLLPDFPQEANIDFFSAIYGHNRLAEYLVLTLPITLVYLGQLRWSRPTKLAAAGLLLAAFIFTFSRLGWLVLALGPAFYFGLQRLRTPPKIVSGLLVSAALIIIAGGLIYGLGHWGARLNLPKQLASLAAKPIEFQVRLEYFQQAWQRWQARPWLGLGPGTFLFNNTDRLTEPRATAFAHNLFLQELNETGVLGTTVTILFLLIFLRLALKAVIRQPDPLRVAAVTGVILSLVHAQFDFGWQIPAVQLTALVLLLAAGLSKQKYSMTSGFGWLPLYWLLALLPLALLLIMPAFNREKFRQKITGATDGQTATHWLVTWQHLDQGNGEMYLWRAKRSLQQGQVGAALADYRQSILAPIRSAFIDLNLLPGFLNNFLGGGNQITSQEMAELLQLINSASVPNDFFHLESNLFNLVRQTVDKILASPEGIIDPVLLGRLYYWKYLFALETGEAKFSDYQKFIDAAAAHDPGAQYQVVAQINRILSVPTEPEAVKEIISELEQVSAKRKKAESDRYLEAFLYTTLGDLYQSAGQANLEIIARRQAIESQPYIGSNYIILAVRLKELDLADQIPAVLIQCQLKTGLDCQSWYEQNSRPLPADDLILGQNLVVGIYGTKLDQPMKRTLTLVKPAGIVLFERNFVDGYQLKALVESLQRLAQETTGSHYLIMADEEPGIVDRFDLYENFDYDYPDIERLKTDTEVLAWLGVNVNLGPIADFPIIPKAISSDRVSTTDPLMLTSVNRQFIEFLHQNGITATLKHFPGLGLLTTDPHDNLAKSRANQGQLDQSLALFKSGIESGADLVMTTHGYYPLLDPDQPVTFSSKIISLLRNQLHFSGLILSDDLAMMPATDKKLALDVVTRQTLLAGHNLVMFAHKSAQTEMVYQRLLQQMKQEPYLRQVIEANYRQIAAFKETHL